jgi:hypothetical protein
MNPFDLLSRLTGLDSIFGGLFGADGTSELLPGSSFHAITAAFATQGYWAQADFIYFINETGFQSFAILVYLIALVSGIVGMAMGAPPKQYLWYFMGPALFHFLLGTTTDVYGTAWVVAGNPQEQSEVWKLAETGLNTSNIAQREGITIQGYQGPSQPVQVSWAFAQLDGVVSETIQSFISWIGVYEMDGSNGANGIIGMFFGEKENSSGRWHLLSNMKWQYLDTIASARLSTPELRDAFISFMAGRCGDDFQKAVDSGKYAEAAKSENGIIPPGIFSATGDAKQYATSTEVAYANLNNQLNKSLVAFPMSLRRILATPLNGSNPESKSFLETMKDYKFLNYPGPNGQDLADGTIQNYLNSGAIKCSHYLDIVVRGFRWESAHLYDNLVSKLPPGVDESAVLDYAMLYGWDIRKYTVDQLFSGNTSVQYKQLIKENLPRAINAEEKKQYIINLIFINMMKNEFLLAPNAAARKIRFTSGEQAANASEMFQKTIGSRNKYGEIYSWALMMPYLQGMLLYVLALGYPFACVMILVPKMSKIMFTWASFWVWAKLWDLGFAIVVLLERSVWATIGNSSKATLMNPFIAQMSDWGKVVIPDQGQTAVPFYNITNSFTGVENSYRFLDRAMTLFSNMDLDLQNSYYIYIMAALYFAVPAVTGQLVLGAKSGVAGLVTGAFSDMAKEVGGRAGRSFSQVLGKQSEMANASAEQAFYAKNLSNGALARALNTQNEAARKQLEGSFLGAQDSGVATKAGIAGQIASRRDSDLKFTGGVMRNIAASPGNTIGGYALIAGLGKLDQLGGISSVNGVKDAMSSENLKNFSVQGIFDTANQNSTPGGRVTKGVNQELDNTFAPANNFINSFGGDSSVFGGTGSSIPQRMTEGINSNSGGRLTGAASAPNMMWDPRVAAVDAISSIGSYNINRDNLDRQAGYQAERAQIGVDRFYASSEGDRMQKEQQFLAAEAKGYSQDNSFYDRAGFQTHLAEMGLGAADISLGNIGSKNTDDSYLARSGMAGDAAYQASHFYADGGAYQKDIDAKASFLNENYGKDALNSFYNSSVSTGSKEFESAYHATKAVTADLLEKTKSILSNDPSLDAGVATLGVAMGTIGNGSFGVSGDVKHGVGGKYTSGPDGVYRDPQGKIMPSTDTTSSFKQRDSANRAELNGAFSVPTLKSSYAARRGK